MKSPFWISAGFAVLLVAPVMAEGEATKSKVTEIVTTPLAVDASKVVDELRLLDAGIDQWAIENNAAPGTQPTTDMILVYFKPGSSLALKLAASAGKKEVVLVEGLSAVPLKRVNEELRVPKDWAGRFTKEQLGPFID